MDQICFSVVVAPRRSVLLFFLRLLLLLFLFLSPVSCQGGEGVFGRALTKRAWIIPKEPEGRNKRKGKEKKNKKR